MCNFHNLESFEFFHYRPIGFIICFIFMMIMIFFCFKGHRWHWFDFRSNQSALDIAKKRYAKGEITKSELDEIKKNIS